MIGISFAQNIRTDLLTKHASTRLLKRFPWVAGIGGRNGRKLLIRYLPKLEISGNYFCVHSVSNRFERCLVWWMNVCEDVKSRTNSLARLDYAHAQWLQVWRPPRISIWGSPEVENYVTCGRLMLIVLDYQHDHPESSSGRKDSFLVLSNLNMH